MLSSKFIFWNIKKKRAWRKVFKSLRQALFLKVTFQIGNKTKKVKRFLALGKSPLDLNGDNEYIKSRKHGK